MSISVLVNTVGSEKDEALMKELMNSLEQISKKYSLRLEKRLSKNIPPHLAPVLYCHSHEGNKMLLLLFDVITTLERSKLINFDSNLIYLFVLGLEALFSKVGLIQAPEKDIEIDLKGFIFDKLSPEESSTLSPLAQRKREEDAKATKESDYLSMILKDKLLCLHKIVHDMETQVLTNIKYEADPDTGRLIRKGEPLPAIADPFEITNGIESFNEYYESASK